MATVKALYFDGVDDYIYANTNLPTNYNGNITYEAMIVPVSQTLTGVHGILSTYRPVTTSISGFLSITYGQAAFDGRRYSNYRLLRGGAVQTNNQYHLVAKINNGEWSLYVNGVRRQTGSWNDPGGIVVPSGDRLRVGRVYPPTYSVPNHLWYRGYIIFTRLWLRALSDDEIQQYLFKRNIPTSDPSLYCYWRMDEGSGNTVYDHGPGNVNGTIYGATWVDIEVDIDEPPGPPGRIDISTTLHGSSSATAKADRIRGLSAHFTGAATSTGGTPIRIRGLTANLEGAGTVNAKMNLIAALKASLQGKATLKSNILVLFVPEGVYVIDADDIFAKDQPSRSQTVVNHVEVWVNPLKPVDEPEEVYRSKDPITIPAGEIKTVTIHFDDEPVTEPAVALEEAGVNLSIVDTKYYAWGADVTIKNAGSGAQTCRIVATGKPLKVQGREVIVKRDEVSIQENGLKKYTFDNPLVQDRATAELIADKLLSFANAKRDIVIEWRGDPALQLADIVMIPEYQRKGLDQRGIFYVTKQELEFDGGLRAKLEGRKM